MEELKIVKERDENIVIARPLRKTVLLCTNGFQTTDTHDSVPMQEYFNSSFGNEFDNCEVVCVKLFAAADKKTHSARKFEKALDSSIQEYIKKGYDIQLMGYSFSASLVAKMAHKYRKYVSRVIFVAPVYDTLVNHMIPGYIKYALKFQKLNKKYGKRVASSMSRQTVQGLPGLLIAIFASILLNRHYFRKVRQDTLLIRGMDDILCTEHSVKKVEKKLKGEHSLYLYPKQSHGILKTVKLNGAVYEDILNFSFGTPYLLENDAEIITKKPLKAVQESVAYDIDGEEIPTFGEIFNELDPDCDDQDAAAENEI